MRVIFILFAVILSSCASGNGRPSDFLLRFKLMPEPGMRSFQACTSYGCESSQILGLADDEEQRLREIFDTPPETPGDERRRIAEAVGLMERIVGAKAGTAHDAPKNTWVEDRQRGQLDCIAETANTTTYLLMFERGGLLKHHTAAHPMTRGIMLLDYHNTAVIREPATGREFAVDSWFGASGDPPHIVPLEAWKSGWEPEDGPAGPSSSEAGGAECVISGDPNLLSLRDSPVNVLSPATFIRTF